MTDHTRFSAGSLDDLGIASEESLADFIYETQNYTDCVEKAGQLWPILSRTAAQSVKVPVAWRWRIKGDNRWTLLDHYPEGAMNERSECEPLYAAQPPAAPVEFVPETCPDCGVREPCDEDCPNHVEPEPVPSSSAGTESDKYVHLDNVVYHLDDIEVDADGKCAWTDVANALTHIKLCRERIPTVPQAAPDTFTCVQETSVGEQLRWCVVRIAPKITTVLVDCGRGIEGMRAADATLKRMQSSSLSRPEHSR